MNTAPLHHNRDFLLLQTEAGAFRAVAPSLDELAELPDPAPAG